MDGPDPLTEWRGPPFAPAPCLDPPTCLLSGAATQCGAAVQPPSPLHTDAHPPHRRPPRMWKRSPWSQYSSTMYKSTLVGTSCPPRITNPPAADTPTSASWRQTRGAKQAKPRGLVSRLNACCSVALSWQIERHATCHEQLTSVGRPEECVTQGGYVRVLQAAEDAHLQSERGRGAREAAGQGALPFKKTFCWRELRAARSSPRAARTSPPQGWRGRCQFS